MTDNKPEPVPEPLECRCHHGGYFHATTCPLFEPAPEPIEVCKHCGNGRDAHHDPGQHCHPHAPFDGSTVYTALEPEHPAPEPDTSPRKSDAPRTPGEAAHRASFEHGSMRLSTARWNGMKVEHVALWERIAKAARDHVADPDDPSLLVNVFKHVTLADIEHDGAEPCLNASRVVGRYCDLTLGHTGKCAFESLGPAWESLIEERNPRRASTPAWQEDMDQLRAEIAELRRDAGLA